MARGHGWMQFQGRISEWWIPTLALLLFASGIGPSLAWGAPPVRTGDTQSGEGTPFEEPEVTSSDTLGNGNEKASPEYSGDISAAETGIAVSPLPGRSSVFVQIVGSFGILLRSRM